MVERVDVILFIKVFNEYWCHVKKRKNKKKQKNKNSGHYFITPIILTGLY